jgi:NADPH-dependent 2,4-dienoyl-CoA reductase/sulfur reductase-like enzyme
MADRLLVIGGDAAGMAAAAHARRQRDDLEIVALEMGRWTSYSACGIPYLVGGSVSSLDDLVARTPQEHRDTYLIDVRIQHEAKAVDLDARRVEVRDHEHDRTYHLGFDLLHMATGAAPIRPPLPGIDSDMVHGVQTLTDAADLLEHAQSASLSQVVVVGGGYIGLELAEAFRRRGCRVTVIERGDEVMPSLDPDIGSLVGGAMQEMGIDVRCGQEVAAFEPPPSGHGSGRVITAAGDAVAADLVVLGLGVAPKAALAAEAGVTLGAAGAIRVDQRQQTNYGGVFAAGDCCASTHRVSGREVYVALGTVANKQGRVAGINLGGGYATFPGVVGTAAVKVCSLEVARTGLNMAEAEAAGFEAVTSFVESTSKAGYLPDPPPMAVKLVVERGTRRILGGQIVGRQGAAKRIDVIAVAATVGLNASDLVDLDLAYAPPFGTAWDPVQIAARRALAL